jgi:rod shape-determining protein MreD
VSEGTRQGGWGIVASFLLAFLLTVLPLPDQFQNARPEWVALVLIYWCMATPERVGPSVGWLVGLAQDALQGALLGQHALAYALLAYLTIKLHQRMRVFPIWQQALSVMVLLLLSRLVLLWVSGLIGRPPADWQYWMAALTGSLIWPLVFVVMREMRRAARVV